MWGCHVEKILSNKKPCHTTWTRGKSGGNRRDFGNYLEPVHSLPSRCPDKKGFLDQIDLRNTSSNKVKQVRLLEHAGNLTRHPHCEGGRAFAGSPTCPAAEPPSAFLPTGKRALEMSPDTFALRTSIYHTVLKKGVVCLIESRFPKSWKTIFIFTFNAGNR